MPLITGYGHPMGSHSLYNPKFYLRHSIPTSVIEDSRYAVHMVLEPKTMLRTLNQRMPKPYIWMIH